MFESGAGFDWATAEALAFGSLLADDYGVRLSGQDSRRGTFSQRHAVWLDQTTGDKFVPLSRVEGGRFDVLDSPLSEYGVMGFRNTATRWPTRRRWCAGRGSSATSPTARRS